MCSGWHCLPLWDTVSHSDLLQSARGQYWSCTFTALCQKSGEVMPYVKVDALCRNYWCSDYYCNCTVCFPGAVWAASELSSCNVQQKVSIWMKLNEREIRSEFLLQYNNWFMFVSGTVSRNNLRLKYPSNWLVWLFSWLQRTIKPETCCFV